ncbi:intradiol ring-cleavage dioxygenase, partial [Nocardioides sp. Root224]|uniref:intradiol ring-cleavage dioxygenase n=1 Tax=Nocardioides sp. Root224 TaxID=1736495 RepID=UPI001F2AB31F
PRPPVDRRGGGAGSGAIGGDSSVEVADGEIPEETAGPYPGDGSNGVNVLTESGIVRSDLTSSFGDASGVAEGVPVTVRLKVYDLDGEDVAALSGAAIYLWHCDRDGNYSMYSEAVADENYLRGVQETDAHGRVEFTTIFPACYSGRWPHMHFEVYQSVDDATSYTNKLRTSQLALPEDVCNDVFATDGYEQSVTNLAQISLDSDGIFSDGYSLQMATVTGSVDDGYTVSLNIPV